MYFAWPGNGGSIDQKDRAFILWFDQIGIEDVSLVGGKNASLGEMYGNLSRRGVRIPNGFAITATAYRYFIEKNNLKEAIKRELKGLDTKNIEDLERRGKRIRNLILKAEIPDDLKNAIIEAYHCLEKQYGEHVDVAVRSSATAEDLPDASFAGQQETYLNIHGEAMLLEAVKKCFASLFTNRAISYREDKGFDHFSIALSVGIQKMVRSDLASSGVMFTIDTETGHRNVVFITSSYGLGENIVQGAVNPDEFYVFKPTLKEGYKPIIFKKLGEKEKKLIYSSDGSKTVKNIPTRRHERERFSLNDDEVLQLARWAVIIEEHYSKKHGRYTPMDIEWAKDGLTNELFIVQARPETVQSRKGFKKIKKYSLKTNNARIIVKGRSVGDKIGQGVARVIRDVSRINEFKPGEVLVTEMTDPDWEPIMKIASAIITEKGGRTCHAAIVARELGIPAVVGAENATRLISTGQEITVDCSKGEEGYVYEGLLPIEVEEIDLEQIPETKTKIMMNIGNPEEAFKLSFLPVKGVGLAREEFITGSYIGIHPLAIINYPHIPEEVKRAIDEKTKGYEDKKQFYIEKLAQGIGTIAAAFWPREVILRLADFKTNEYKQLIGGHLYEPEEENPMLGWRGASRYYSKEYSPAFGLEIEAIKKVRNEYGLKNLNIMVPFCRTPEEGKKVLAEMEKYGLRKGEDGLKVYVMCEIPSNVLMADEFLEVFDGFSIGSNDLTQLTMGIDRDNEKLVKITDERNPAVKKLISQAIKKCREKNKYIGICGDAPSTFKEFAEWLVEQGIESMSLSPDAVLKTLLFVAEKEKNIKR
ncbi:phosphoenolpyruvate synthase [Candidatus Woesearchaeota archaeon]|nr:phosphoenolpyruvate synthase [Candidatus Woesearchaeota archaeon]